MGLSRSDALSIGRGVGAEAVQAVVVVDTEAENKEIIAGQTGKTLYLNYIEISISDTGSSDNFQLTDGSGGTAFWDIHYESPGAYQPRAYSLHFGEYGFALTQDNGLFGVTDDSSFQLTVTALGCWR
jgi:hypothetical protein